MIFLPPLAAKCLALAAVSLLRRFTLFNAELESFSLKGDYPPCRQGDEQIDLTAVQGAFPIEVRILRRVGAERLGQPTPLQTLLHHDRSI